MFHDSHLPLNKWFAAVALIVHAKKGMSAKQMQRHLAVSYRTAWYMGHRIRKAMADGSGIIGGPKLSGTVEMDETYVGGKQKRKACVRGRGANKEVVVGLRERGGDLRFVHTNDARSNTLYKVLHENVSEDADKIMTDDFAAYPPAMGPTFREKHQRINHSTGVYAIGDLHTNTIESAFSLLKRGIVGSFHVISPKHLHRYLSEFEYRFNRRELPDLFSATVTRMLGSKEMRYSELVAN